VINVVGVGDGDFQELPASSKAMVLGARVVIGGRRHLDLLPPVRQQERHPLPSPLKPGLLDLLTKVGVDGTATADSVVMLASGDPLTSGIGSTLIAMLGAEMVCIHPWISSETFARARMRWPAETTQVVTAVGRDIGAVRRHLAPGAHIVVLCPDGTGPSELARLLVDEGCGESSITAWWHLGGPNEGSQTALARAWGDERTPDLVVACVVVDESGALARAAVGSTPGHAESAFEHDGQLTKRDARTSALAHLRPMPGAHLWDLGAGSGSVGIEWALAEPRTRVTAVEAKHERAQRIVRNAVRLGVGTSVTVIEGDAAMHVPNLQTPDAVFIGGGLTRELLAACWGRLRPGGRFVAHAVTLESEAVLFEAFRELGGTLTRIAIEHAVPLGRFVSWTPLRPIVQWSATKPTGQPPGPGALAEGPAS